MTLNAATKLNLQRKSAYVDTVQMFDGVPIPSWIDLSLTELCNRSSGHPNACKFCPRIDPTFYPNQNSHMSLKLVEKIASELYTLDFKGVVVLCGYGEPLLHPKLVEIVKLLKGGCGARVEVVTNGDFLGSEKIKQLVDAGLDYFVVSLYDGPHQVPIIEKAFFDAGEVTNYLIRDRWHTEADQFGLKLTNRGGTVDIGPQDPVDIHKPCFYTAYQLQVDWNGDVLLCPQDWHKKLKFGNLNTDGIFGVWTSKRMQKRRRALMDGHRSEHPCSSCNTDGTLHGSGHKDAWLKK